MLLVVDFSSFLRISEKSCCTGSSSTSPHVGGKYSTELSSISDCSGEDRKDILKVSSSNLFGYLKLAIYYYFEYSFMSSGGRVKGKGSSFKLRYLWLRQSYFIVGVRGSLNRLGAISKTILCSLTIRLRGSSRQRRGSTTAWHFLYMPASKSVNNLFLSMK